MYQSTNGGGYKTVSLYKNQKIGCYYIHQLLAKAFIPNPDNLPVVDHISRVKTDNRLDNLRWSSFKDNMLNKSGKGEDIYEYFEKKPENTTPIFFYNNRNFRDYYIDF